MKYNFIGDIHGKTYWKQLIEPDSINVFMGDYFSPYEKMPFKACKDNFLEIIDYKKTHRDTTVLLIGNHDTDHWLLPEYMCRHHTPADAKVIYDLFEENAGLFTMAYNVDNKGIATHAGISYIWYMRRILEQMFFTAYYLPYNMSDKASLDEAIDAAVMDLRKITKQMYMPVGGVQRTLYGPLIYKNDFYIIKTNFTDSDIVFSFPLDLDEITNNINNAWPEKKHIFSFEANGHSMDGWGDWETHSPIWIRLNALYNANIFHETGIRQFVGHTQVSTPTYYQGYAGKDKDLLFTDCQNTTIASLIYDSEKNLVQKKTITEGNTIMQTIM